MSESEVRNRVRFGRGSLAALVAVALGTPELRAAESSPAAPGPAVPLLSVGPRLGAVAWGRGAQKNECAGPCARFAPDDVAYSHLPAPVLGADALFGALDLFRFGIGALYAPVSDIRLAGATDDFEVGGDLAIDLVAEVVVRATPRVWVLPRIQGGPIGLFPGGDLRALLDTVNRDYCAGAASGCESLTGSYWGWNIAAGAGALWFLVERIGVRADFSLQYYAVPLYTLSSRLATQPIQVSERLTGGRLLFTLGAEFH